MSRFFSSERPKRSHLVRPGKGGVAGEVGDLRQDVGTALDLVELVLTPDGGFAMPLINKTGAESVKGTIVEASETTDFACQLADANSDHNIGAVYTAGVADGGTIYVAVLGFAYVLLKDTVGATHGHWVGVSDVAGRAFTQSSTPALAADHNKEVGHCFQTVVGGTNKLVAVALHQN